MKKIWLTLLAIALTCSFSQAQTVDEILDNYFEITGGKEAWRNLEAMKIDAKVNMGQMAFDATMYRTRPNHQRMEFSVQGKTIVQAYDGTDAWAKNPLQPGGEAAQRLPEQQSEEMKKQMFEDALLDYEDKGHTIELEGKETIDGTETFKLKLTKNDGDVEYHFFDTENFIPIMTRTTVKSGPQKGQQMEQYMSDYQEAGDVIMPFYMETRANGQVFQKITIESVEMNPELKEELFAFPGK